MSGKDTQGGRERWLPTREPSACFHAQGLRVLGIYALNLSTMSWISSIVAKPDDQV